MANDYSRAVAVVRLRPDTMLTAGARRHRLLSIAGIFAGIDSDDVHPNAVRTLHFSAIAPNPGSADELLEPMKSALRSAPKVIFDLDFPVDNLRQGLVDNLLASVFGNLLDATSDDQRLLLVLRQPLPPSDWLARVLAAHPRGDTVAIVDTDTGRAMSPGWTPDATLVDAIRTSFGDLVEDLRARTLRRRGVFRPRKDPLEYMAFWYSPSLCLPTLTSLLVMYFRKHNPDFVVYDSERSWLANTVLAACAESAGTMAATIDDLFAKPDEQTDSEIVSVRARLHHVLEQPERRGLVIVPLTKSGRTLSAAVHQLRSRFHGPIRVLSVMMDEKHIDEGKAVPVEVEDEQHEVDFFIPVRQQLFTQDDWQFQATQVTGRFEDPEAEWAFPSIVGLWTLYESLGCGIEEPYPKRRRPIRWTPQIHRVDEADALWLAESLVRVAEARLNVDRSSIVILMPDETSGARPISLALRNRLDVAVVRVPRDVIEGRGELDKAVAKQLQQYGGRSLVLADESTMTYETLHGLERLITATLSRRSELALVALELAIVPTARRPKNLESLHSWRPAALVETADG